MIGGGQQGRMGGNFVGGGGPGWSDPGSGGGSGMHPSGGAAGGGHMNNYMQGGGGQLGGSHGMPPGAGGNFPMGNMSNGHMNGPGPGGFNGGRLSTIFTRSSEVVRGEVRRGQMPSVNCCNVLKTPLTSGFMPPIHFACYLPVSLF